MTHVLDEKLTPSSDAVTSRVGDEIVLLNLADGTYYGLDSIGAHVWERLADGTLPRTICQDLATRYAEPIRQVEADVSAFLTDLKARKIVIGH